MAVAAAAAAKAQLGPVGLVDVCTILCDNSEVSKRDGATGKPVALAEGCEGGPVRERVTGKPVAVFAEGLEDGPKTLDLTKWDFNKVHCRTKCRTLMENSEPLLLIGSPIDSGGGDKERARGVLHLASICELYEQVTRHVSDID